MLKERKGAEFFPAVNVKAIDTTAAGDAFIAGMIWSLSEGKSLRESVRVPMRSQAMPSPFWEPSPPFPPANSSNNSSVN